MDSNGSNSSTSSTVNKKSFQRKKFTDGFEQLLSVEVCPQLWITVQKSKTQQGNMFVDIRRRKEGQWKGNKIFIPTHAGLFLKYAEYEKFKQKLEMVLVNIEKRFDFSHYNGRRIIGLVLPDGTLSVELKTDYKEAKIILTRDEIDKLISHAVADGIASAMSQVIYEE